MSGTQNTNSRYDGITFSNTAVESVLRDIRTGNDEFVTSFFAARPDWQDDTTEQTDDEQETAQA